MSINVLIIDDNESARENIGMFLEGLGYEVVGVGTMKEARECVRKGTGDVILLDVQLPDGYGPSLLFELDNLPVRPSVIVITAFGDIETAVEVMKNGAVDFLAKPIDLDRLELSVQRAAEMIAMRRELAHLREYYYQQEDNPIIGSSTTMKSVLSQAKRAAMAQVSVLITGETGVGKDLVAHFIHSQGPRAQKPFIAINCAAIQSNLLESELFGYEAGAFTGAERRKHGLMETAEGGVLFLDEISSMPTDIQAKLLRAIEERAIRRVGATNMVHVDVQIVAASNRDLQKMIDDKEFRSDLYYRLKVVDLDLPSLRERKTDIPELAGFFLRHFNMKMGMNVEDITPRAMKALIAYDWPGNIRQLNHTIERAMIFCDERVIDLPDLPSEIIQYVEKV